MKTLKFINTSAQGISPDFAGGCVKSPSTKFNFRVHFIHIEMSHVRLRWFFPSNFFLVKSCVKFTLHQRRRSMLLLIIARVIVAAQFKLLNKCNLFYWRAKKMVWNFLKLRPLIRIIFYVPFYILSLVMY